MRAENKRLTHAAACGSGALPKRPRHAGMIRIPNLTFMALFDHVQTHLQRWARGRANLAPRAYAADVAGVVTVLGPVDNYRAAMTAAARKMLARKLVSVLS